MPYDAMEQERRLFCDALYIQRAGDTRQGGPYYEALIDVLRCGEAMTKRIPRELQQERLVER
jgi:hypothetical protein